MFETLRVHFGINKCAIFLRYKIKFSKFISRKSIFKHCFKFQAERFTFGGTIRLLASYLDPVFTSSGLKLNCDKLRLLNTVDFKTLG